VIINCRVPQGGGSQPLRDGKESIIQGAICQCKYLEQGTIASINRLEFFPFITGQILENERAKSTHYYFILLDRKIGLYSSVRRRIPLLTSLSRKNDYDNGSGRK
jgi:hypothetical protein